MLWSNCKCLVRIHRRFLSLSESILSSILTISFDFDLKFIGPFIGWWDFFLWFFSTLTRYQKPIHNPLSSIYRNLHSWNFTMRKKENYQILQLLALTSFTSGSFAPLLERGKKIDKTKLILEDKFDLPNGKISKHMIGQTVRRFISGRCISNLPY